MVKFKLYYDKDKEIEWLNEMAMQGHALSSFFAVELIVMMMEIYGGIRGISAAWLFALIVGALVCVFFSMISRTKGIIAKLMEQKCEAPK